MGPPFFNAVTTPLAIVLVLFTGIGPLLAWRRVSAGRAWRLIWPPALVALVVTGLLVAAERRRAGAGRAGAVLLRVVHARGAGGGGGCAAASAQRDADGGGSLPAAAGRVVARNRRRYGGYLVHAGIAVLFIAVAASSSFQTSSDVRLDPGRDGDRRRLRGDLRRSRQPSIDASEQRLTFGATLDVRRDGEAVRGAAALAQLLLLGCRRRRARLLRGRGDQRGGPQGLGGRRLLDRDAARPDRSSTTRSRPPTPDRRGRRDGWTHRRQARGRGAAHGEPPGRSRSAPHGRLPRGGRVPSTSGSTTTRW